MTATTFSLRLDEAFASRGLLLAGSAAALAFGASGVAAAHVDAPAVALVAAVFAFAGYIKGLTAIGLPTVAISLLSFGMSLPEAMALVALPALASNFWQAASGGRFLSLARRLLPLLVPLCVTCAATVLLLGRSAPAWALTLLASVLIAYGALGLARVRPRLAARWEPRLSPAVGVASGFVAGISGVPMMPVLPYLQALDLEPEELVQSLGIVFCAASLTVAMTMAGAGAVDLPHASLSVGALVPTLAGMALGQAARRKLSVEQFKIAIFVALLGVGLVSLMR